MAELTSKATERLAREALELHRLTLAAESVKDLRSPATPVEKNTKGVSDPTASAAMCGKRLAVGAALGMVARVAPGYTDNVRQCAERLRSALDTWDGRKN